MSKRKESRMNRFIMEEFHNNPAVLRRRLSAQAHRERNRAMRESLAWLIGSLGSLATRAMARLRPGRPVRWIERLG
jgi:hypothetical protein